MLKRKIFTIATLSTSLFLCACGDSNSSTTSSNEEDNGIAEEMFNAANCSFTASGELTCTYYQNDKKLDDKTASIDVISKFTDKTYEFDSGSSYFIAKQSESNKALADYEHVNKYNKVVTEPLLDIYGEQYSWSTFSNPFSSFKTSDLDFIKKETLSSGEKAFCFQNMDPGDSENLEDPSESYQMALGFINKFALGQNYFESPKSVGLTFDETKRTFTGLKAFSDSFDYGAYGLTYQYALDVAFDFSSETNHSPKTIEPYDETKPYVSDLKAALDSLVNEMNYNVVGYYSLKSDLGEINRRFYSAKREKAWSYAYLPYTPFFDNSGKRSSDTAYSEVMTLEASDISFAGGFLELDSSSQESKTEVHEVMKNKNDGKLYYYQEVFKKNKTENLNSLKERGISYDFNTAIFLFNEKDGFYTLPSMSSAVKEFAKDIDPLKDMDVFIGSQMTKCDINLTADKKIDYIDFYDDYGNYVIYDFDYSDQMFQSISFDASIESITRANAFAGIYKFDTRSGVITKEHQIEVVAGSSGVPNIKVVGSDAPVSDIKIVDKSLFFKCGDYEYTIAFSQTSITMRNATSDEKGTTYSLTFESNAK